MGFRDSVREWWSGTGGSAVGPAAAASSSSLDETATPITKAAPGGSSMAVGGGLRGAMSQGSPGGWASDHRAETNRYTGWNYVAARAIALQCAQAQVNVYQEGVAPEPGKSRTKAYNEQSDKGEPLGEESRLVRLLKRPSPKQSGASFRYEVSLQLSLTGTALIWNVKNQEGLTIERYVIPTAIATPQAPTRDMPQGSWYISPEAAHFAAADSWFMMSTVGLLFNCYLDARHVQVIRWPHPLYRDDGQSPVAAGAMWTDTADMVDRARWAQMKSGHNPSLAITPPDGWDGDQADLDAAEALFNQRYGGADKNRKAMFVTAKEIIKLSSTGEQMDFENAFPQVRDAILAIHGTPGVAAGVTDGGSYAAFYAALLQFTMLTIQPQLSLIAEEDSEQLAPQFGAGLTVEMLAKPIDDPQILENQLRTDLQGRIRTRNEIRLLRGLPPIDGPLGEELAGAAPPPAAPAEENAQGSGGQGDESASGFPGVPQIGLGKAAPHNRLAAVNGHSNGHSHNGNGHTH